MYTVNNVTIAHSPEGLAGGLNFITTDSGVNFTAGIAA